MIYSCEDNHCTNGGWGGARVCKEICHVYSVRNIVKGNGRGGLGVYKTKCKWEWINNP
jgi:hypothetical protein